MAKIYSLPKEFEKKIPVFDFAKPYKEHENREKEFLKELKDFLIKQNPNEKHVGEIIDFPVADGKAMYMVISLKPVELLYLPLGDAWQYQYVHKMNKKDIIDILNRNIALKKLFS
jgi:hypothetical protein